MESLAKRRPDLDPTTLVPTSWEELQALIKQFVDVGTTKFVVLPMQEPDTTRRLVGAPGRGRRRTAPPRDLSRLEAPAGDERLGTTLGAGGHDAVPVSFGNLPFGDPPIGVATARPALTRRGTRQATSRGDRRVASAADRRLTRQRDRRDTVGGPLGVIARPGQRARLDVADARAPRRSASIGRTHAVRPTGRSGDGATSAGGTDRS